MFETLEVGRKISGEDYDKAELSLRQELLNLQFELQDKPYPVYIIVAGVEGAGKGSVVHRFNEWMDPRLIETHAFWDHSEEQENRPFYWRFWRAMPAHGKIGIYFGSWYTRPIIQAALGQLSDSELDAEMQRIAEFEHMLSEDGALMVKLWFHVDEKTMLAHLDKDARELLGSLAATDNIDYGKRYKDFRAVSERAIRLTDRHYSPWHLIEASNNKYRDLTAGEILRQALYEHIERQAQNPQTHLPDSLLTRTQPTILDKVDTKASLAPTNYKAQLKKYQARLTEYAWEARKHNIACVAVFEGWDAAGKGSAIRRVTWAIDPRLFRVVQFSAPTDEESAHHYLWRFWRQLGRDGKITIFDRSWYGRVLVERVEGFASTNEWQRAYSEINRFEEQLTDHGSVVMKFWIHISQEEQLARFKQRAQTPHKQHKITEEDWRNREKWHDYEIAVHDMVTHTSTAHAPWTLVAGNDKRYARIQILKTFCKRLETAIKNRDKS